MPDISGTNRPLPPIPGRRPKRPPLRTGKVGNTGRTVQTATPKRKLPKRPKLSPINPLPDKPLKERKVAATESQAPYIKRQAKDVIPEMMPGKVQPPPRLGNVKIGTMLGQGAFGKVFLAQNDSSANISETPGILQKNYVVKDQNLGVDPNVVQFRKNLAHAEVNFQRQARGAVRVTGENVYQGRDGVHHQVMMEHGGQELAKIIARSASGAANPLDEGTCRAIGSQLISQLSSLHRQGVAHRDIKPENVLVNHQGKARLSDFGLSQKENPVSRQYGSDDLKFSGSAGTPVYMAPETFHAQTYSEKADCWSMGMMLSELLTGERPPYLFQDFEFQGQKYKQFNQQLYNQFTRSILNHPELSSDAKSTILSMIALDPRARPSAEQTLNLPFFQSGKTRAGGAHFQLQSQHQEAFQQLAHFEQMLESAEARLQDNPDETTAREVASLGRQVSAMGVEVKSLQAKMELEDLNSELKQLDQKMNSSRSWLPQTKKQKQAFSDLSVRYYATRKDVRLKEQEANYLDQAASLMQQKNSLIAQVEVAQNGSSGRPTRKIAQLMMQALEIDNTLQIKDLENQLGILKIKQNYFIDHQTTLTSRQRTEAKGIAATIKNTEKELTDFKKSSKGS
ncbi:protein kinase [Endozoicomonas gorgoniicola]|uniref:Protein kinase n=1 Tax=Endozoicomonas gorgoniicola TaxID=1234144 RepID=A0ABT3MXN7_9GAMM|nr:serine/threonine-protein kinase [Endozoicomonas gorgoniicola]MCW7554145.1 protein kinase [Endozoicomonas gorgoniicola]